MVVRTGSLACALALIGCAPGVATLHRPGPDQLPSGSPLLISNLAVGDAWLRHHLMVGDPGAALALFEPDEPTPVSDDLLAALQRAVLLRESGDLQASNDLLEWADQETERRRSRSVSRTAASFIVSDRVLEYTPTRSESAMIPFYRMMNYLAMEETTAAAVEARRVSALLAEEMSSASRDCWANGLLQYVSGLAFEAAKEHADAVVSLRQAEASFDACRNEHGIERPEGFGRDLVRVAGLAGLPEIADSARVRYEVGWADGADQGASDVGEVIVLVERDFIAHRSAESIHVPILEDDFRGVDGNDSAEIANRSVAVAARLISNLAEREMWGRSWDDEPVVRIGHALSGSYVLKLAWPGYQATDRDDRPATAIHIGGQVLPARPVADLSALARAELSGERQAIMARLLARAVTKYLLANEIERSAEEKGGDILGFLAGRIANYAANETERPDTRSWTLLPDRIMVARVQVPAGTVSMRLGSNEESEGGGALIGPIDIGAGERRMVLVRSID